MITIIIGTNRKDSMSSKVAIYYQSLLPKEVESQILDLQDLPADFTDSALYHNASKNQAFNQLIDKMKSSDSFVFVIPEYNGSFPGVLKAFVDGLPYPNPVSDKTCALVGLGSGVMGGALALSHFDDILSYLHANTVGTRVKIMQIEKNFSEGKLTNDLYNELIQRQIKQLV